MISVVIPCRNAESVLPRQLNALLRQRGDSKTWELILVDNGSADGTLQVMQRFLPRFAHAKIVDAASLAGINVARNAGVRAATHPFVVLCDADDEVGQGWVAAYEAAFANGTVLAGGDLIEISRGQGTQEAPGITDPFDFLPYPIGANCGFTRSAWEAVGGFDESYRGGGDEADFFWRAQLEGYSVTRVGGASVRYYHRDKLRDFAVQQYKYGKAQAKLYRRFRDHGMPRRRMRAVGQLALGLAQLPGSVLLIKWRRPAARRIATAIGRLSLIGRTP